MVVQVEIFQVLSHQKVYECFKTLIAVIDQSLVK